MGSGISNLYDSSATAYEQWSSDEQVLLRETENQPFRYNSEGSLEEKRQAFQNSNIDDNDRPLIDRYGVDENGYFGNKGRYYRTIYSEDPISSSIEFNNIIGKGGKVYPLDLNQFRIS